MNKAYYEQDWGPEPAHRKLIERVCALVPHRAQDFWKAWNTKPGISRVQAEKLIADLTEARKQEQLLPPQPSAMKLRTLAQTAQRTREEIDAEMEQAKQRQRKQLYDQTLHTWIEIQYANRLAAEAWQHRYDPMGLWGPMTLASGDER